MEEAWYVDILLGTANLDTRGPGSLLMTSFNYILHPGYDPSTLANDLAIVQLPIGIDVRSGPDIPPGLSLPRASGLQPDVTHPPPGASDQHRGPGHHPGLGQDGGHRGRGQP